MGTQGARLTARGQRHTEGLARSLADHGVWDAGVKDQPCCRRLPCTASQVGARGDCV